MKFYNNKNTQELPGTQVLENHQCFWFLLHNFLLLPPPELPRSWVLCLLSLKKICFNWESSTDIYTPPCGKQIARGRALSSVLCDDLEGWDGGSGREAEEGRDMWILRADSLPCMEESNTTLQSSCSPIIKNILLRYG